MSTKAAIFFLSIKTSWAEKRGLKLHRYTQSCPVVSEHANLSIINKARPSANGPISADWSTDLFPTVIQRCQSQAPDVHLTVIQMSWYLHRTQLGGWWERLGRPGLFTLRQSRYSVGCGVTVLILAAFHSRVCRVSGIEGQLCVRSGAGLPAWCDSLWSLPAVFDLFSLTHTVNIVASNIEAPPREL